MAEGWFAARGFAIWLSGNLVGQKMMAAFASIWEHDFAAGHSSMTACTRAQTHGGNYKKIEAGRRGAVLQKTMFVF